MFLPLEFAEEVWGITRGDSPRCLARGVAEKFPFPAGFQMQEFKLASPQENGEALSMDTGIADQLHKTIYPSLSCPRA